MTSIAPNELLPEQIPSLDALKASIEKDANDAVKAEAMPLQEAINNNDRGEVMTALRTLEARLESLSAVDDHREKLREAKYAVGGLADDIDTAISGGIDTTKRTVVDPAIDAVKASIPIAKDTVAIMKEKYAKLPTALRLPVLGTLVASGSYLGSYLVKGFGKLLGYVSEKGGKVIENMAEKMKTAGKVAFLGGLGLGAFSYVSGKYQEGAFDSTLDAMKSKYDAAKDAILPPAAAPVTPPTTPAPAPVTTPPATPPAAPSVAPLGTESYTFIELKSGVMIDGKKVRMLDGPAISINDTKWNIELPYGTKLMNTHIDNGAMIVEGKFYGVTHKTTLSPENLQNMLNTLATTRKSKVPMLDNNGSVIRPGISFEVA